MNIIFQSFKRIEFMQRTLNGIFLDLLKIKRNAKISFQVSIMSKNNLHISLKVVYYIFISISALAITTAKYVIA